MSNDDNPCPVRQMPDDKTPSVKPPTGTYLEADYPLLAEAFRKMRKTDPEGANKPFQLPDFRGQFFHGPVSGSDSVEGTLDGYDDFIRSRLTPMP